MKSDWKHASNCTCHHMFESRHLLQNYFVRKFVEADKCICDNFISFLEYFFPLLQCKVTEQYCLNQLLSKKHFFRRS